MMRRMRPPSSAVHAVELFMERTGVDPRTDDCVRYAAQMSAIAAVFRALTQLAEWYGGVYRLLRGVDPPYGVPEWAMRIVGDGPKMVMTLGKSARVDPGLRVDLVRLVKGLARAGTLLKEELPLLRKVVRELRTPQRHEPVGVQPMIDRRGKQRPVDDVRARFVRRLHREWMKAGRGRLGATETLLAAIAVGLEEPPADWPKALAKWAAFIRRERRKSKK